MLHRAICVLAGLMSAFGGAAQEPENFYPYETESEERAPMLLTDSVLFYRAVQSPPDLYDRIAGYALSFVRVARRGQSYESRAASVEGLSVAPRYFSVLRALGAEESGVAGLAPAEDCLGLNGGVRMFRFSEGDPTPGARASVHMTDRNYLFGAKLSYADVYRKGWSFASAVDVRTGRDMYVEGVFTNAVTAAVRLQRRLKENDRVSLVVVVPPSMRGVRSTSSSEAFTLTGDRLYNPAWGYQNGQIRNSHVRRECLPLAVMSGVFDLSESTRLAASLGAEAGVSKYSTLGWYDARTPVPDHYRYLPGFTGDRETEEVWRMGDSHYTQIDWDELYAQNRMADGEAAYALEDRVENICKMQANVNLTTWFHERLALHYGLSAQYNSVRSFKQMRDLLGARYVWDIDQFLVDDDTYGTLLQNNLQNPNRRIGEGGRFGYDYALRRTDVRARVLAQYHSDRLRAELGAEVAEVSVRRRGYYEKELYPGALSFGRSAAVRFTPYTFKLSGGWSFSPRSYFGGAVMAAATEPDADALFFQPQYNNRTVDDPSLCRLWAAELTYNYTGRVVDLRVAAFVDYTQDDMDTYRYYDDLADVFCNMSIAEIDRRGYGLEAAANVRLSYRWRVVAALSAGSYEYVSDPKVTVVADRDNAPVDRTQSRMSGIRAGNAPQLTGTAEISYFGRGWGWRAGVVYAGLRYAEPAFLRRTERVVRQAAATPEAFVRFTQQERLRDAFTLNASVFKSFYFDDSRLTCSLMLRNLLSAKDAEYAAYESQRVHRLRSGDGYVYTPAESRRMYAYPRSFYLSVTYSF